ncbi:MAG: AAA family ATPase [Saprospiraceae bacterium]
MPYKLSIPFHAFQLHIGKNVFTVPLSDQQSVLVGVSMNALISRYGESLRKKVLQQGKLDRVLDEIRDGDFLLEAISVTFPEAKDGISFPSFTLVFDCFYQQEVNGYFGVIPVLGLEGYGQDLETLFSNLQETIRLDFVRKRKLNAVQDIISTIWFDQTDLLLGEMELSLPSPKDLDELEEQHAESMLQRVATELQISRNVLYGFEAELNQFQKALQSKFNKNILLVGPHGVGKTTLVWELAFVRKKPKTKGKIWETTASTLIKELMGETGWQDNLSVLCKELSGKEDLLFIRNLMELFEVGKSEGNQVSMAQYLRPFISRGELNIIAECTEEEMANIELRSPNYLSFFQVINMQPPTGEVLDQIILQKVKDIAANQDIHIEEDAIREVIRLNQRFNPYSGMPGKPIHFFESILINKKQASEAIATDKVRISKAEVIKYFCDDSGMPIFMVDPSLPMDTEKIKARFNEKIYGQAVAVNGLVEILAAVKTALARKGQPIASLLFVGPTGVGKTELAKVLANFMFGNESNLVRFDMSEYSNYYAILRLIGTDYFNEGLLTSAVRKSPFCVLLFDEIEKAHPTFFDLLLQVLSEGRLSDNQGKTVNFCSTIIIMTSNIGAEKLQRGTIGWEQKGSSQHDEQYISAIENYFRPELFNRIDRVIPFQTLDQQVVRSVVEREIQLFKRREGIRYRRMDLFIDDKVLHYLAKIGYHPKYGARQLQRSIQDKLIIPLARHLNQQDYDEQIIVNVSLKKEKITFKIELDPLGLDLLIEELEKDSYADYASKLRHEVTLFKEGHFFIQILNELENLKRLKKHEKQKFWNNPSDIRRHANFTDIVKKVKLLERTIQDHELSLSLASLRLEAYQPNKVEELKVFENDFFQAKRDIYALLNPKSNACFFYIYGANPQQIFDCYQKLFLLNGFEFTAQTVWFRESYYNEEIWVEIGEQRVKKKRAAYIKKDYLPDEDASILPEKAGDQLFGIEMTLNGPCVYLYLEGELGAQKWQMKPHEHFVYLTTIHKSPTATSDKIHRQDFYRKANIRRSITATNIKDNILRLDREYRKGELVELLKDRLDADFKISLNAEML